MVDESFVIYTGVGSATAIHIRWETIRTWLPSFYKTHNLCSVGLQRPCHSKTPPSIQNKMCRERQTDWLMSLTDEDKINLYFDVEIAHSFTGAEYRQMIGEEKN